MANIRLLFEDNDPIEEYAPLLECFVNHSQTITIRIFDSLNTDDLQIITLDKSSAIRFAKTLRTQINKIQE